MRYLLYTETYSKNLRSRKIVVGGMVRGQIVRRAWWQITDSDCMKKKRNLLVFQKCVDLVSLYEWKAHGTAAARPGNEPKA